MRSRKNTEIVLAFCFLGLMFLWQFIHSATDKNDFLTWCIFIGIFAIPFSLLLGIVNVTERIGQRIRDKAAHEALDAVFDFEREKGEILEVRRKYNLQEQEG